MPPVEKSTADGSDSAALPDKSGTSQPNSATDKTVGSDKLGKQGTPVLDGSAGNDADSTMSSKLDDTQTFSEWCRLL